RPAPRGRPAPRRRSGTSPADRRAVGCASDSQAADRIEGDHLLEAPVAEAVDPAALEVPPGGLQMAGILDVADAVRLAHLLVDLALVLGLNRGQELPEGVDERPVVH